VLPVYVFSLNNDELGILAAGGKNQIRILHCNLSNLPDLWMSRSLSYKEHIQEFCLIFTLGAYIASSLSVNIMQVTRLFLMCCSFVQN